MKETETIFTTINETAKLTGLARSHIRSLCKSGVAPCIRIGNGANAVYKIHYKKFCEKLEKMIESEGKM